MARIRTIKPDVCTSESLARLDPAACWTWACLWTQCDDQGRHRSDGRLLKAALYPLRDDMSIKRIAEQIDALEVEQKLCRYVGCDGKAYLHILGWEHQKIDRPTVSRIPPCPKHEPGAACFLHSGPCGEPPSTPRRLLVEPSSSPREDASPVPSTWDLVPSTEDLGSPVVAKTRRARPIGDFVLTAELREWAADNEPAVDVDRETSKFVDHFTASGKPAKDWTAAWRNWIRNSTSRAPIPTQRPLRSVGSTTDTRVSETLALAAKYREEGQ
jgi:hypothetical protein